MRLTRLFVDQALDEQTEITLKDESFHYLCHVLRLTPGTPLIIFNGQGGEYAAQISKIEKRSAQISLNAFHPRDTESKLDITLALGVSKGDHMDYAIQKCVELGVTKIIPVNTEYTVVNLRGERQDKRHTHWQQIAIQACQQSERNRIPSIHTVVSFTQLLNDNRTNMDLKLVFHPYASSSLRTLAPPTSALVLIGPEGGLSEQEITASEQAGFQSVCFGPRILRTETAAAASVTALQTLWGDLG